MTPYSCAIDSRSELLRLSAELPRKMIAPALAKLQPTEALAQYLLVSFALQPLFSPPENGIIISQLVDHLSEGIPPLIDWKSNATFILP
jgi:hypothetical protein